MMTNDWFPHQARLYAEKDRLYSSWQLAQREQARGRGLPRSSPGDETHAALGMSPLEPQPRLSSCHTSSQGSEGGVVPYSQGGVPYSQGGVVPSSPSLFDSIDAYYRYRSYARVLEPCMQVLSTAPPRLHRYRSYARVLELGRGTTGRAQLLVHPVTHHVVVSKEMWAGNLESKGLTAVEAEVRRLLMTS
jgi:hypothetical protein